MSIVWGNLQWFWHRRRLNSAINFFQILSNKEDLRWQREFPGSYLRLSKFEALRKNLGKWEVLLNLIQKETGIQFNLESACADLGWVIIEILPFRSDIPSLGSDWGGDHRELPGERQKKLSGGRRRSLKGAIGFRILSCKDGDGGIFHLLKAHLSCWVKASLGPFKHSIRLYMKG